MNTLDKQYQELLQDILDNGVTKSDRTGTGTISVFGRQIRHKMSEGFPLLTTKKIAWKVMITELLWFLKGDTNIKYLVDNGCNIWNGDAYKNYCNAYPDVEKTFQYEGSNIEVRKMTQEEFIEQIKTDDEFTKKWGELGPIYGHSWRKWGSIYETNRILGITKLRKSGIDQIQNLINDLKTNSDSRRLMVSAWNVSELDQMTLPPCHYGFQVYTRELKFEERWSLYSKKPYDGNLLAISNTLDYLDGKNIPTRSLSLMYNARSQDVPLGTPFNLASYGLLLILLAKEVNMVPDELISNMGDCHIYLNQVDGVKEQLTREPYQLPDMAIIYTKGETFENLTLDRFQVIRYKSHPTIKIPLSN